MRKWFDHPSLEVARLLSFSWCSNALTFGSIRVFLMVGTGGDVPSQPERCSARSANRLRKGRADTAWFWENRCRTVIIRTVP